MPLYEGPIVDAHHHTIWDVKNKKWYKEMQEENKLKKNKHKEIRDKYDQNRGAFVNTNINPD